MLEHGPFFLSWDLLLLRGLVPPRLCPKLEICTHVNKSYLDKKFLLLPKREQMG